jgi:hypothetical protein
MVVPEMVEWGGLLEVLLQDLRIALLGQPARPRRLWCAPNDFP